MGDKYRPLYELGCGAFGRAWVVTEKESKRKYVSKIIQIKGLSETELDRCLTEVVVLSTCNHVNIVRYIEAYVNAGALHIVMEYANGGDLQQKVQKQNGIYFSKEVILQWFIQVIFALDYIHSKNILHRDLKPQNVFLMHSGIVKLGDFGIARVLSHNEDLASTRIGTPYYISPEICERKPYNSSSDMWGAGCLLYEMCLLRVPFNGSNITALNHNIVQCRYDSVPREFGATIQYIISRLLLVAPDNRLAARDILSLPELSHLVTVNQLRNLDFLRGQRSRSSNVVKEVQKQNENISNGEGENKLDMKSEENVDNYIMRDLVITRKEQEGRPLCLERDKKVNNLNLELQSKKEINVKHKEINKADGNKHYNIERERSVGKEEKILLHGYSDRNKLPEKIESDKQHEKSTKRKVQPCARTVKCTVLETDKRKDIAQVKQDNESVANNDKEIAVEYIGARKGNACENKVISSVKSMGPDKGIKVNLPGTDKNNGNQYTSLKSGTYSVKKSVFRKLSDVSPKLSATIRRQRFSLSVSDPEALHQKRDSVGRAKFSGADNMPIDTVQQQIIRDGNGVDDDDGDDVFVLPITDAQVRPRVNSKTYVIKQMDMFNSNNNTRGTVQRELSEDTINSVIILALSVAKTNKELSRIIIFNEIMRRIGEKRAKIVIGQVRQLIIEDGQSYGTLKEKLTDGEIKLIPLIAMFCI